jgi:hypothetical protein
MMQSKIHVSSMVNGIRTENECGWVHAAGKFKRRKDIVSIKTSVCECPFVSLKCREGILDNNVRVLNTFNG